MTDIGKIEQLTNKGKVTTYHDELSKAGISNAHRISKLEAENAALKEELAKAEKFRKMVEDFAKNECCESCGCEKILLGLLNFWPPVNEPDPYGNHLPLRPPGYRGDEI